MPSQHQTKHSIMAYRPIGASVRYQDQVWEIVDTPKSQHQFQFKLSRPGRTVFADPAELQTIPEGEEKMPPLQSNALTTRDKVRHAQRLMEYGSNLTKACEQAGISTNTFHHYTKPAAA